MSSTLLNTVCATSRTSWFEMSRASSASLNWLRAWGMAWIAFQTTLIASAYFTSRGFFKISRCTACELPLPLSTVRLNNKATVSFEQPTFEQLQITCYCLCCSLLIVHTRLANWIGGPYLCLLRVELAAQAGKIFNTASILEDRVSESEAKEATRGHLWQGPSGSIQTGSRCESWQDNNTRIKKRLTNCWTRCKCGADCFDYCTCYGSFSTQCKGPFKKKLCQNYRTRRR